MKLGLLGGTFDPPHYGHLIAAQEAAWQLKLDRVLFLPTRQNQLKEGETASQAEDRCRMVELAIADNSAFALSRTDLERPGPSYTVDLLKALRVELGPAAELFFIVGADIVSELWSWREPDMVVRLATLVAVSRPGWPTPDVGMLGARLPSANGRVRSLRMPGVDISSTEIRARVAQKWPIRYLLPPEVEAYVHAHGLYRTIALEASAT